jgi:hypothetical protein
MTAVALDYAVWCDTPSGTPVRVGTVYVPVTVGDLQPEGDHAVATLQAGEPTVDVEVDGHDDCGRLIERNMYVSGPAGRIDIGTAYGCRRCMPPRA